MCDARRFATRPHLLDQAVRDELYALAHRLHHASSTITGTEAGRP
jgi:hypothetical protein